MNLPLKPEFRAHAAAAAAAGLPAMAFVALMGLLFFWTGDNESLRTIGWAFMAGAAGISLLLLNLTALLLCTRAAAAAHEAANPPPPAAPLIMPTAADGRPLTRPEIKKAYRSKQNAAERFMWRTSLPCAFLLFLVFGALLVADNKAWALVFLLPFLAAFLTAWRSHVRMENEAKTLRRQYKSLPAG